MLRGLLITPNRELARLIRAHCQATHQVVLLDSLDKYLDDESLRLYVRAHAPQVIFVDLETAPAEATRLMRIASRFALVPFGLNIASPLSTDAFREAMERAAAQVDDIREPQASEFIYSFFPAKPGDGASILAANTAMHLARLPDNSVLYADLDLPSGISRFLLKLPAGLSAADALAKFPGMDRAAWNIIVAEQGALAVLGSGEIGRSLPDPGMRVRYFIDFARRRYRMLILDLDGRFDELGIEAISESRRAFLVVTPDLASIHMAGAKLRFLRDKGLDDRVSVVLNCWRKDAPIHIPGIEELLGVPILQTLPEDRAAIVNAVMEGGEVATVSPLGKELMKLAYALADSGTLRKAGRL